MARLDDPITDIIFVCSEEKCPKGYTVISKSPCGREAQLWEKVLGGESGTRYLCYTKEDKDGTVIEEMYIPRRSADRLRPEFKIVEKTVEGKEPMYHRQLAVKRAQRSKAKKVVADVIVCRGRDNVSKLYKKMDKVNGLRICFRQTAYTQTNAPPAHMTTRRTSDPETHLQLSKQEGVQNRRATVASEDRNRVDHLAIVAGGEIDSDDDHSHYTPSPPSTPSPTPDHPAGTYDATISDMATMYIGGELESVPPQPSEPLQSSTATSYYPPPTNGSASYSNSYAPPTQSMPTQAQASGYPPTSAYPLPQQQASSYNYAQPPTAGYNPQPAGYNPQPVGYYPQRAGYSQPSGIGFSGGYHPSSQPPAAAPGYSNYAAVAGSGFMGTTCSSQPSGPAPYNPFQQGAAAPYPPPMGTYPTAPAGTSTYPPPPSGTSTYPPPPQGTSTYPPQSSGRNYGFNF